MATAQKAMNPSQVDVVVCGAGASGLTMAIELARRNIAFVILEKIPTAFHGSRGKGIQPRTLEVFDDLGIADRLFASGGLYPKQRSYKEDGTYVESDFVHVSAQTPAEPYRFPIMLPQFKTEEIMRDRLAELGHRVHFNTELIKFEQSTDQIVCELSTPQGTEIIHTRYLVGCDGGKSSVRKMLEIDFPGKTLGVRALVADVVAEGVTEDAWHRYNEGNMQMQLSICPLRGTNMLQIQGPISHEIDIDLSVQGLNDFLAARVSNTKILVKEVKWGSLYFMNARLADKYQVGRAFLCGDAAHIHPPTGGQGLNTSVQDAYNLAWKLAAVVQGASEKLLLTYEEERRPIAADILGLSTALLDAMKAKQQMHRGRETHQLDLGYSWSSLCLTKRSHSPAGELSAGDRAPDASVETSLGLPARLFNYFRGPHWTLLGYEPDICKLPSARRGLHIHVVGEHGEIVDKHGQIRKFYDLVPGEWALIRPDGYVGSIVSTENLQELLQYLEINGVVLV